MVDAKNFLNDYCSRDELRDRGIGVDENDSRVIVQLLVDQIECADVLVVTKTDLIDADDANYVWKRFSAGSTQTPGFSAPPMARCLLTKYSTPAAFPDHSTCGEP